MICKKPVSSNMGYWPCGQCLPCRINKRRIWTNRMMLEGMLWTDKTFVTLTYSDDKLVYGKTEEPILVKDDLRNFMKKLRKKYDKDTGRKIRFFGCGEYGDKSDRPHYHVALFNFPSCKYGKSRYSKTITKCCYSCEYIREVWGQGNIWQGQLERKSAQYIAGYVTKKMTSKDDERLRGRTPEFARMSNRPGIGAKAMEVMAATIVKYGIMDNLDDVPKELMVGKKKIALGNYLTRKLRQELGKDQKIPQKEYEKIVQEMLPMYENTKKDPETSVQRELQKRDLQKIRNIEGRSKIYSSRRTL